MQCLLVGNFLADTIWDSLCFLDLCVRSSSQVREVFSYYIFKYILSSLYVTPIMQMLACLILYWRSLEQSFFFFNQLFFFFLLSFSDFHYCISVL